MSKILFWIVLISLSFSLSGQISQKATPLSWARNNAKIQVETIEYFLENKVSIQRRESKSVGEAFQFAEVFEVNKGTNNSGTFDTLPDGCIIWRLRLKSPGAYSINITFGTFIVPEGVNVFVYNSDRSAVLGAFTCTNNKSSRVLPVSPVPGDDIIIEMNQEPNVAFTPELFIETLGHDFTGAFGKNKDGNYGKSGDCNIDINCTEGTNWQTEKRAACRMIVNNSDLCTGTLINNAKNDETPYVLTANHCINSNYLAQRTVFVFNYESPVCNGSDGSTSHSISGSELIATKNKDIRGYLDFALVKLSLDVPAAFNPYFAGWNASETASDTSVCIHHPEGDVKKISIDYQKPLADSYNYYGYDTNTFWKISKWDVGTTEGGSSGGSLMSIDKKIIGTLTGGWADCTDPVNDYFQRFSISYSKYDSAVSTHLKPWLDPENTGITKLEGYDPYGGVHVVYNKMLLSNWVDEDKGELYKVSQGVGYISGNNDYGDLAKAEFFDQSKFNNRNYIDGIYVLFGHAVGNNATNIDLLMWHDNGKNPSEKFAQSSLSMKEIKSAASLLNFVYFKFDRPVYVNKSFYAGIMLPQNVGDSVAIITNTESIVNTAWELQHDNTWMPYSDLENSWGIKLTHAIFPVIGNYDGTNEKVQFNNLIEIFPNPASNYIILRVNDSFFADGEVSLYNTYGIKLRTLKLPGYQQELLIPISNLENGLYIIETRINGFRSVQRIIKN